MQIRKTLSVDEIDLSSLEFWTLPIEEREGAFSTLRQENPIPFTEEADYGDLIPKGRGYWSLTRNADIREVSRNPQIYSSAQGATSIADMPPSFLEFFGGMINMDDPRHGRQRRIVSRGFTPRALRQVESGVERRADAVIDRIIEKGSCDVVADLAAPLPLQIICDMMGIPESEAPMVLKQTNTILGLGDPEFVEELENVEAAAIQAGSQLASLMIEMANDRRKSPKDDLTTALVNTELEDGAMTDSELASFFILLVVAGNETTRNVISHGVKLLCEHPDQRKRWAEDVDGLMPTAVEELIRCSSPVMHMRRTCTQDTVLSGQEFKQGDKVVLWYSSGNRDEVTFDQPYVFDVGRTPNDHVGFGGPGPHYCLGANLARREISVMFRRIFDRIPDFQVTGPPVPLRSNFINGIKRMPCEFSPGQTRG